MSMDEFSGEDGKPAAILNASQKREKEIRATTRPKISYEHPDLSMYWSLFTARLTRLTMKKPSYDKHDRAIALYFQQHTELSSLCDYLSRYVIEAFQYYGVCDHALAYYPGSPSQQNARTDAIEGVSRVLPTLAAWLHYSDTTELEGLNGQQIDVAAILSTTFLAGTSPAHAGYWGNLHDYDQRTCEAADLALALWLSKAWVWDKYSAEQQQQISLWFYQVNHVETVDNNWHLFVLMVQLVMQALTGKDNFSHEKYARVKEFYVGEGWFRDGAQGNYDYYNAWGFHYSLYWMDQIAADFDPEFIHSSLSAFVSNYRYFFTPEGLPFFGRSACYRLAAAAPLLAAVDQGSDAISAGEAKRAFRTNLSYFIGNGAMQCGAPTQGLFADDARLVDNYSGPASSFWSLRALNIALFSGHRSGLWAADEMPLPVEQGDFSFEIESINAYARGVFETKETLVLFQREYTLQQDPLSRRLTTQSWRDKGKEWLSGRATRPKNNLLRKGVTLYSSKMTNFF